MLTPTQIDQFIAARERNRRYRIALLRYELQVLLTEQAQRAEQRKQQQQAGTEDAHE